jgi:hypothetical protein
MTTLPRLYARFRTLFSQMDLPLRSALEGMLTSFAAMPLPTTTDEHQIDGDFVGFDGIENRGKLSNLLESEWLSRELDPDDFVRRISEGEVMFRRLDFKGTGTKDVLCVVLDCGPWMLGGHRIIALASLFYLALRAERIGAQLQWIVPGVSDGWSEGLTQQNIRSFLGQMVQDRLLPAAIDQAVEGLGTGPKECWYVGAAQTNDLAQHPDITGSISVQARYASNDVEVQIASHGRKSKLHITAPPDAEIVAALRRPFTPDRKARAKVANDEGDLTAYPCCRDWLLDRFNQAVIIRYPRGLLWYPFRKEAEPTWIATPEGQSLLGIQPQSGGKLGVLLGDDDSDVSLVTVDVSGMLAKIVTRKTGYFNAQIGTQPPYAMGNLHIAHGDQSLFVTSEGTTQAVLFEANRTPPKTDDHTIFSDGVYLIEQTNGVLRVRNPRRGTLARARLPDADQDLYQKPRRLVFSPDTKAITFTTDGVHHTALLNQDIVGFVLEGLTLLYFHSASRALAWDAAANSLVQFKVINDEVSHLTYTEIDTPVTGMPRYCPLTQSVFAMNTDDAGAPQYFVPLETNRGWQNAKAFDIPDAIERAKTLWL